MCPQACHCPARKTRASVATESHRYGRYGTTTCSNQAPSEALQELVQLSLGEETTKHTCSLEVDLEPDKEATVWMLQDGGPVTLLASG